MCRMRSLLTWMALFCLGVGTIQSARILAIFPFPGASQYIAVKPYLKALAARGHQVTSINGYPLKEKLENFRDIPVTEIHDFYAEHLKKFLNATSRFDEAQIVFGVVNYITEVVLSKPIVQRWLRTRNEQFDLVIVEALLLDSLYAFGPHFGAPLIGCSSFGTDYIIDEYVGNVSPLAYSPLVTAGLSPRMTYWERLKNIYLTWQYKFLVEFYNYPVQERIYKENFPHLSHNLRDIRRNFSLILLNQHFSTGYPRPYVPNMIEVGGFHIQHTAAPLPTDIENFILNSPRDVIYFSLGSNIKSKDLSSEQLQILLKVFASLDTHVLWKFEEPQLPGKSDNVMINPWFPQADILAHPKVKLFFSHCGLLSMTEALYHGKPMLCLPIMYDQFLNANHVQLSGFGLTLDLSKLQLKETLDKIHEITSRNGSYSRRAAELSLLYRDQPMPPLERAIYWTEYVHRHRGAPHMKMLSQEMGFIRAISIDTISLFVVVALITVGLVLLGLVQLGSGVLRLLGLRGRKPKAD